VTLPAMGMGIYGLVLGVILGAMLHLAIQIPGLILTHFHWSGGFGFHDSRVIQILRLMGPRLVTVFFLQLTFIPETTWPLISVRARFPPLPMAG
jgi:putative peptidoglycan lipid II flippase